MKKSTKKLATQILAIVLSVLMVVSIAYFTVYSFHAVSKGPGIVCAQYAVMTIRYLPCISHAHAHKNAVFLFISRKP